MQHKSASIVAIEWENENTPNSSIVSIRASWALSAKFASNPNGNIKPTANSEDTLFLITA
jgi:hypothetical protein